MFVAAAALGMVAPAVSAAPAEVDPGRCAFGRVPGDPQSFSHEVTYRRGMTCSRAKAILRGLRGDAELIPMACMTDRTVDGWHLRNLDRDSAPKQWTQYRRGQQVINYTRREEFDTASCIPVGGFVFDGV